MQPDVSHSRANFRSRFQAFPRSSLWTVVLQFLSCFHLEIQNNAPTLPQSQTKNDVNESSWKNAVNEYNQHTSLFKYNFHQQAENENRKCDKSQGLAKANGKYHC